MKRIISITLVLLALFDVELQLDQMIMFSFNVVLVIGNEYMRYQDMSVLYAEILLQMGITIQLALKCSIQQVAAILILMTESKIQIKLGIAVSVSVNAILHEIESPPLAAIIPYMFVIGLLQLVKLPKLEGKTTQLWDATNPLTHKQSVEQQHQQPMAPSSIDPLVKSQDEDELQQQQHQPNSQIMLDNNEQDDLLENMAWIHNQTSLVFTNKVEVIYQNFFIGSLAKKDIDLSGLDFEQLFLDSTIEIGSREINEMFCTTELDELHSESFLVNGTSHSRYKIRGRQKVRDLLNNLFDQYQKWKHFTFTIFKLSNQYLDYSGMFIKVLIMEVKQKQYVFFLFDTLYTNPAKRVLDEPTQFQSVFATFLLESNNFINSLHLYTLLCLHECEKQVFKGLTTYLGAMRMITQKHMIFIANMKDLTLQLSGQLILKNTTFRINDIIDELQLIFDDCLNIKEVQLVTIYESDFVTFNDSDRTKQVMKCLIDLALRYSGNSSLRIDVRQYLGGQGIMVSVKDVPLKEETVRSQCQHVLKTVAQMMRSNCKDFDLSLNLELQVASIISYQLSGSIRRPLECIIDLQNMAQFILIIESNPTKQVLQQQQFKNNRRLCETSLSMLLAQAQDSSQYRGNVDDSKFFSMSQLSKGYSMKPSDYPIDMQIAHFSQVSKIKNSNESPAQKLLSQQPSFTTQKQQNQESFILQPKAGTNTYKIVKSESAANDSSRMTSQLDFGDSSNPQLNPPQMQTKFLGSIIKYKLTNQCCSKVLIADSDYYSVQILQILLQQYEIKSDKSFQGAQCLSLISKKAQTPCRCRNRSYLLYFIDVQLPNVSGLEIIKDIRKQFRLGEIDKGFLISTASYSDVDVKLDCFNAGVDYYLNKPYDLFELSAILQYMQF